MAPVSVSEDDHIAAVGRDPDLDAPRLAYADWLRTRGDPRGELIALQITHGDPVRERELLATHGASRSSARSRSPRPASGARGSSRVPRARSTRSP
jgi:uncharacterized protein (TIGR02996 family)